MKSLFITVGNSEYELNLHAATPLTPKTPLLVYVTEKGCNGVGSYVYTIGRGTETYNSVLYQGTDVSVQDLAQSLGRVLVRKFVCPSYVCMSGRFVAQEYGELSRAVVSACEGFRESIAAQETDVK